MMITDNINIHQQLNPGPADPSDCVIIHLTKQALKQCLSRKQGANLQYSDVEQSFGLVAILFKVPLAKIKPAAPQYASCLS